MPDRPQPHPHRSLGSAANPAPRLSKRLLTVLTQQRRLEDACASLCRRHFPDLLHSIRHFEIEKRLAHLGSRQTWITVAAGRALRTRRSHRVFVLAHELLLVDEHHLRT